MFSFLRKSKVNTVSVEGTPTTIEVAAGKTLLEAMLGQGLAMPHDCKVGSCGTCKFKLVSGKIGELSPSALALEGEEVRGGYRLACQAIPRSDLTIAVDTPLMQGRAAEDYRGTIVAAPRLCKDIIGLTIELDRPLAFTPGQYADLTVPWIEGARSYSFACAALGGPVQQLHFHIRHVPGGAFTDWLFGADRTGTELMVAAPFGQFALKDGQAPMLCIAGGSGLAPIVSILQQALAAGGTRPVHLLYGARRQDNLYALDEIESLRKRWHAPFTFTPALSDEAAGSDWEGARGLITELIDGVADLPAHEAYLCGPPAMIDLAEAQLLAGGVDRAAISADRFLDRGSGR
ncbi:xylene monooxygenase electron transfer subunit [Novosphingobium kunmingense]|uniref:Xylene monooxygenase electron transfer subunit n=1 Tax=Novosphingobium kunmingense TaxID=1211806 RepID=A0A2N0H3R2_9SPHN|nr:xylene monooxygenase electron transfer subunit [Novosphingobium kunmingense]